MCNFCIPDYLFELVTGIEMKIIVCYNILLCSFKRIYLLFRGKFRRKFSVFKCLGFLKVIGGINLCPGIETLYEKKYNEPQSSCDTKLIW